MNRGTSVTIKSGGVIAAVFVALLVATICVAAPSSASPRTELAMLPPPTVETGSAIGIGPRGGIITGVINPNGQIVSYWIAFGRRRPSEHHTGQSEEKIGGSEPREVEEVVENLREGTTYRYRLVALYGRGKKKVFGGENSFTTKSYFEDSAGEIGVKPCHR